MLYDRAHCCPIGVAAPVKHNVDTPVSTFDTSDRIDRAYSDHPLRMSTLTSQARFSMLSCRVSPLHWMAHLGRAFLSNSCTLLCCSTQSAQHLWLHVEASWKMSRDIQFSSQSPQASEDILLTPCCMSRMQTGTRVAINLLSRQEYYLVISDLSSRVKARDEMSTSLLSIKPVYNGTKKLPCTVRAMGQQFSLQNASTH